MSGRKQPRRALKVDALGPGVMASRWKCCSHLKRILKLDRLRLRGLTGAHDEFLLAATAQNLRRVAKRLLEGQQRAVAIPVSTE